MRISRRGFLAAAAAAPLAGGAHSWKAPVGSSSLTCALDESRAGYDIALRDSPTLHLIVCPGAVGWDPTLVGRVRAGATVLFESAAGFGEAGAFDEQRAGLRSDFGLTIDAPNHLPSQAPRPAYIDLLWPTRVKVRDFSSLVTVRGGETIGTLGPLPVAALRREGAGRFLFVGSPVGPALWSGDRQAHAWLSSVAREAVYSRAYMYPSVLPK